MTDKIKARFRAIPLLVCSLGCVALALPSVIHTASADTTTPISSDISYDTPLTLSNLGTWEVGLWYNTPNAETPVSARNIQFSVPMYYATPDSWEGGGEQYNSDSLGYVSVYQEWYYTANSYTYFIGNGNTTTPGNVGYLPTASFKSGAFALTADEFTTLCENTVLYLPLGVYYNVSVTGHLLTENSALQIVSYTGGSYFTAEGETVSGTPFKSIYELLGGGNALDTSFFELTPKINGCLVFADLSITLTPDRLVGSTRTDNTFTLNCIIDRNIAYGNLVDNYETYANYVASRYAPQPSVGDTLMSPLTSFFETELFEGFSMGALLIIALGCLLFGLFLKIFVGG